MNKFISKTDWLKVVMMISLFIIGAIFRFGIPTEPNDRLIFDENYFVLQTESYMVNRFFNDPHGIVGRIPLYIGHILANPDYKEKIDPEKLSDKSDSNYSVTLNLEGIRFFPKLFGSFLPVSAFILVFQLVNWKRSRPSNIAGYLIPYLGGLLIAFDNGLILDSRLAMLAQPMFFFMLLTLITAISYFNSKTKLKTAILFLLCALTIGLTMGTKMVAYSVIPFALVLVWVKEFVAGHKSMGLLRSFLSASIMAAIVMYLGAVVYLGTFTWHFSQIKNYSPAANEVVDSYKEDLKNGTDNTSFLTKYWDWQQRSLRYQSLVPELDYTKKDEIGSMWITWPVMARPISYWTEYSANSEGKSVFVGLITISNPVVWFGGLAGVIILASLAIGRFFGRNGFGWRHVFVLGLYFANWLPFALINRVMYIYHYYPALIFSVIVWAVVIHDFIIPRLVDLPGLLKGKVVVPAFAAGFVRGFKANKVEWVTIGLFALMLFAMVLGFYFYAPFTYKLPVTKSEFESRMLLKEWNVKWTGGN